MKIEIIKCDVCGATPALTHWFTMDRRLDGAGSMEDVQEPRDLCPKCLWRHFKALEKLCASDVRQEAFDSIPVLSLRDHSPTP